MKLNELITVLCNRPEYLARYSGEQEEIYVHNGIILVMIVKINIDNTVQYLVDDTFATQYKQYSDKYDVMSRIKEDALQSDVVWVTSSCDKPSLLVDIDFKTRFN